MLRKENLPELNPTQTKKTDTASILSQLKTPELGFNAVEQPTSHYHQKAKVLAEQGKEAAGAAIVPVTLFGLIFMFGKPHGDPASMMHGLLHPISPLIIAGGLIIDPIKLPIFSGIAALQFCRAGVCKALAYMTEKSPTEEMIDKIYHSFLLRLEELTQLLVMLELETTESIEHKIHSGDIENLVGLTLLETAYMSRDCGHNNLLLASNKILERKHCPEEGLALFNKLIELKNQINEGLDSAIQKRYAMSPEEKQFAEAKVISKWVVPLKNGVAISYGDVEGASATQVDRINRIISTIDEIKKLATGLLSANQLKPEEKMLEDHRLSFRT